MSKGGIDLWRSGCMLEVITRAMFECPRRWWVSRISPGAEARLECIEGLSDALVLELQATGEGPQSMLILGISERLTLC